MFKHIVVGVDGREGGRDAVALARLPAALGGKLTLAFVVARDAHAYRGTSGSPEASDGGRAEALLEAVRRETGVEAHLRWYGSSSVGRGLHELCGVIGADLLVVGSSRRGLLGRVLIGDDTSAALNGAPCAIAIAPSNYSQQPGMTREIGSVTTDHPRANTHSRWPGRSPSRGQPSSQRSKRCRFRHTPLWGQERPTTRPSASSRMPLSESQAWAASNRTRPTVSLPRSWRCTAHRSIC